MTPQFKTKAGRLTRYALACGYVEQSEWPNGIRLQLWHEGGPCFHVRAHDHKACGRLFWDAFESLPQARKRFDQARRQYAKES